MADRAKFQTPVIPDEFKIRLPKAPGKEFITANGLVYLGHLQGLKRVTSTVVLVPTKEHPWAIVHCEVETDLGVFSDYGETNASNQGSVGASYPLSMAATRARNRALRIATGCPLTSYEEMDGATGDLDNPDQSQPDTPRPAPQRPANQPAAPTPIRPTGVAAADANQWTQIRHWASTLMGAYGVDAPLPPEGCTAQQAEQWLKRAEATHQKYAGAETAERKART